MMVRFISCSSFLFLAILKGAFSVPIGKNGCKESCGNVSFAYPFGVGDSCSMNEWFNISCDENTNPPTISLPRISMEVLDFGIPFHEYLHVKSPIFSQNCSNHSSQRVNFTDSPFFFFSSTRNKFIGAGCNSKASMKGIEPKILGCESDCAGGRLFGSNNSNNTCNEGTCCETVTPDGLNVFDVSLERANQNQNQGQSQCRLAFVVEEEWFRNNVTDYSELQNMEYVPALLYWRLPEEYFELGSKQGIEYYCKGYISENLKGTDRNLSLCYCREGYEGNAYLPNGCQDKDECKDPENKCVVADATCVNKPGTYECETKKTWIIPLGISLGFGVSFLVIGGWCICRYLKKRMKMKLKKKFFKRNGGLLLQQQMSSREGSIEKNKIFASKEMDKATDGFNKNRVLGQGGQGTVYKGMLSDGRIVAVKRSKVMDAEKVEEFINEVVILSQINHRNVVKLLGCCLETEVPLLIYEYVPNGTLFQYLHDEGDQEFQLSWEIRLRIAREIAEALWYMHSAASVPIYHRDIKSSNILLDDKYRAKLSDFGTSRSFPIDQTHLTTHVQGTFGYLDPEYFQSSQFTEKSDVYSFGVVLVELITGQKPILAQSVENGRSLATHFIGSMEENRLLEIVDARIVREVKHEEMIVVAKLAYRCLSLSGKKRPTMKEIAMELGRMLSLGTDSNVEDIQEEIDYIKIDCFPRDISPTSAGSIFDSVTAFSIEMESLIHSKT